MTSSTLTTGDNLLPTYYVPKALITLKYETPLYDLAKKEPLSKGNGVSIVFSAWHKVAGASVALSEGTAPTAFVISGRKVSATIAQQGRLIDLTDIFDYASVLRPKDGAMEQLKVSAKETLEYICHQGIFKAAFYGSNSKTTIMSVYMSVTKSAFCANTGTNNTSNKQFQFPAVFGGSCSYMSSYGYTAPSTSAKASIHAVRKAVRVLRLKGAQPFEDGYFAGYAHTNFLSILHSDPSWREWNQYTNSKETMYAGEDGRVERVRFIHSQLCPRYAVTNRSVNITFIFGRDAFGVTEMDELSGLEIYQVTGASKSDPLNQHAYLGYKITAAAACLNPSAGVLLFTQEYLG